MEDYKKKNGVEASEKEIVFSQAIKAGKRIYYLDVKKNRRNEMFLAITESKKIVNGEGDEAQVSFEKHKIFLYREDFEKFLNGLNQAVQYITNEQGEYVRPAAEKNDTVGTEAKEEKENKNLSLGEEIKIDIDF